MNDQETTRDLIARASTLGEILKMMPGAAVDDTVLRAAIAQKQADQLIGDVLVRMGAISVEQRDRAVELQAMMRNIRDVEELEAFFHEIQAAETQAYDRVFAAIPTTNPGEHR